MPPTTLTFVLMLVVLEFAVIAPDASSASSTGSRSAISLTTALRSSMWPCFAAHQPAQIGASALSPRLHHQRPCAPSTIAMKAWLRISARVGHRPCEVNWKNWSTVIHGRESFTASRAIRAPSATALMR
ncbi:MAG: hypothetical protein DMD90_23195 [Candidatus Rokuibacteriota bacterium]|nr:MAG: hypothetical protein DMD90_23195 [Candidatus Rokubacteria bacterium]PYN91144.1 MAG: hypothetical protein DMD89_31890 [Candidatus Rokubacteria bacterium]